jgi:hypothetical protein
MLCWKMDLGCWPYRTRMQSLQQFAPTSRCDLALCTSVNDHNVPAFSMQLQAVNMQHVISYNLRSCALQALWQHSSAQQLCSLTSHLVRHTALVTRPDVFCMWWWCRLVTLTTCCLVLLTSLSTWCTWAVTPSPMSGTTKHSWQHMAAAATHQQVRHSSRNSHNSSRREACFNVLARRGFGRWQQACSCC